MLGDVTQLLSAIDSGDPKAAEELLTIGEQPSGTDDPVELAAYTAVANVILNLDETINRE